MQNASDFKPLATFTAAYISHARDYAKSGQKDFARDLFRFISGSKILPLLKATSMNLFMDLNILQNDLAALGLECHPQDAPDHSTDLRAIRDDLSTLKLMVASGLRFPLREGFVPEVVESAGT
jgi:hypothetical protein